MGSRSTNYEVYHIKEGRWHLHANYAGERRDEAIEEAKALEKEGHIEGTCVVKESYDSRTNEGAESVVYHSPSLKSKPNVSTISGGGAAGKKVNNAPAGSAAANAAKDAAEKEKKFQAKQRDEIAAQQKNEPALRAVPTGEEGPACRMYRNIRTCRMVLTWSGWPFHSSLPASQQPLSPPLFLSSFR